MFEQLFPHQATVARYRQSPFVAERELYLSRLMQEGRSLQTLRNIAWILMYLARHLPLHQAEITPVEIEAAAATWAMTTRRSATCLHIGMREFVFHATNWMRLLGRLREPAVKRPFAAETDAFLQFAVNERGLEIGNSSSDHIQLYTGNAALLAESLEVIQRTSAVILGAIQPEAPTTESETVAEVA